MSRSAFLAQEPRTLEPAVAGDPLLGPLAPLPGKWRSNGRGWNMIALPFASADSGGLDYRLLLNQFDEDLDFLLVDKGVPNRGVDDAVKQQDQHVVTIDYQQVVHQVAVTDRPASSATVTGAAGDPIHHEPGLFLNFVDQTDGGPDVARLATVPHGDAALAVGTSSQNDGPPVIPAVDGLPVGVGHDLNIGYLAPYKFFHTTPFVGTVSAAGFPGFDPTAPHGLLELANHGVDVEKTTTLDLSTATPTGGISNVPFVVKHANATSMRSIFWIQQLTSGGFRLQYLQIVLLEFFPRFDGQPGLISWPHVSINTLDKISDVGDVG